MQPTQSLIPIIPLLLCATVQPQAAAPRQPRPVFTNRYEAPIVTRDGQPIEYTAAELDKQWADWLARGGSLGLDLLGGCEEDVAKAAWKYYIFGTGIGASGLAVSAVGGVPEIVTTCGGSGFGGNRYWMILRRDQATGEYQQQWVSPVYTTSGVARLEVGDLEGNGEPRVVIATSSGEVEIWDQASRELLTSWSLPQGPNMMRLFDLDDDGDLEILTCTSNTLTASSHDGQLLWSAPAGGGDLIAGQMDGDPAYEIALTDGDVVDCDTHQVQWHWANGFGSHLEAGDIDDDGMDELIAAQAWSFVWAYDVDTQLPKWSLEIFNIGATALVDIDEDDVLELIIGEAQWGDQLAYDTQTLQKEWGIYNPEHGTTEVVCGDADGDGDLEVIWGAGHSSSGSDHMFVADWQTQQHQWSNIHLDGPLRGPVRGDIDGDGEDELVTVSNESDSGYGSGRVLVFDLDSLKLRAISQEVAGGLGWSGTHRVILRDVDEDEALEIVVGSSTTYDGTIEIYDFDGGSTFTKIWEVPNPKPDGAFRDVEVIDVDGDGALEVVGGASGYVHVYDLETATLEWTSLYLSSTVTAIGVGDTDDDPALEILALGTAGDLYVFDGQSKATEAILFGDSTCLRISPLNVAPDLVVMGTETGNLTTVQFAGGSYATLSTVNLVSEAIDGFTLRAANVLFVGSSGVLSIFSPMPAALWSSCSVYGSPFGARVAFGKDYGATAGVYGLVAFKRH